jgi:endonuclease/exonuclease/phosphatase family metal-dependent hydrolase
VHGEGPGRLKRVAAAAAAALAALAAVIFTLTVLVHLRVPAEIPPAPGPGEIRVVTYNIRAGIQGLDGVIEDLRRLTPDVIALQEIERGVARSMQVDQPTTIAEALGMQAVFAGAVVSRVHGEHGVAILSRFPLSDAETIPLPQGHGRWPRVALRVRVDAPTGPFRMVCVHLARPYGWPLANTTTRLAQIRSLLDRLAGDDLPIVLAGDLNSFPVSLEVWTLRRRLQSAWRPWRDGWAPSFGLRSIGWPFGGVKIDHVFHDPAWSSRGTWSAPRGSSDHRPVVVDLVPGGAAPGGGETGAER